MFRSWKGTLFYFFVICAESLRNGAPFNPQRGPGGTGTGALRFHRNVEPFAIDRHATFFDDLGGEFDREAVGVVEQERGRAGQLRGVRLEFAVEDAEEVVVGRVDARAGVAQLL